MSEAEVIIVGGGPAGLSTGLFLCHAEPALRGRVVLLEREPYPRDKPCAGALGARADRLLARIGVSVDVPSVPIEGVSLRLGDGSVRLREGSIGRVVRRVEYDHALAGIAAAHGVCVVDGARVTGAHIDAHGVDVTSSRGRFRGRALVGADGVGSVVRRLLGVGAGRLRAQVIELDTEPVAGDPGRDLLHFDASDRSLSGYAWDFPTVAFGRSLVCRGVYELVQNGARPALRERLARRLEERGLSIDRYPLKRYAERGFDARESFAAPRVLLVGEAAGIDALTGEGIAQAIAYGAFAGPYLAEKWRRRDFTFADYRRRLVRSAVGLELGVRARFIPHFFGARRPETERFLLGHPGFVAASIQHFGGKPIKRLELARSIFSAAWITAGRSV